MTIVFLMRGAALAFALLFVLPSPGQNNWPGFGGDPGQSRYSTLDQITPANVSKLRIAWTYDLGTKGRKWETTPLVVNDRMYFTLPQGSDGVVAVDPLTGAQFWKYESKGGRGRSNRAVSYWPGDAKTEPRLLFASGDQLIALAAKTGEPVKDFGDNGAVNLRAGVADNYPNRGYSVSSPPAIYRDLAILGPSTQETGRYGPSGARAPSTFELARWCGASIWCLAPVSRTSEPGAPTVGRNVPVRACGD